MTGIISDNVGRAGGLIKAAGGGGKVLQFISADADGQTSSSSTSYTASGVSQAITPTNSSSKMWVTFTVGFGGDYGSGYAQRSTRMYVDIGGAGYNGIGQDFACTWNDGSTQTVYWSICTYHDHNTTSELTYKPYFKTNVSASTYFNYAVYSGVGGVWSIFEIEG